jgi:ATP synthase protein I
MEKYSKVTNKDRKAIIRAMSYMSQIAISSVVCVLIGVFAGLHLDRWLGTAPWLLLIFSLLGCLSAFKVMIDIAKKF